MGVIMLNEEKFFELEERLNQTEEQIFSQMSNFYEKIKSNPYDDVSREALLALGDVMNSILNDKIYIYDSLCPNRQWADKKISVLEERKDSLNKQLGLDSERSRKM